MAKECCATNYHGNYSDKLRVFRFPKETHEFKRSLSAISNLYTKKTRTLSFVIDIGQRILLQLKFLERRNLRIPHQCSKMFQKVPPKLPFYALCEQFVKLLLQQEICTVMADELSSFESNENIYFFGALKSIIIQTYSHDKTKLVKTLSMMNSS